MHLTSSYTVYHFYIVWFRFKEDLGENPKYIHSDLFLFLLPVERTGAVTLLFSKLKLLFMTFCLCRTRILWIKRTSNMGVKTFTHSSTSHSQEMLEKLNALRNEGHLCDVTIRVQDKLFLAHKVVLACCSEFFRSKLVGRPEEEDKFVLDLHHVTVSGFAPLLEYAYTSTLSISTENIIDVLAAASYMQMFAVASTCSEFMKSSILWTPGNNNNNNNMGADKPHESAPESASSNCALTPLDGSVSPVSSDCSVMERNVPICRESRRKRKSFVSMASPESPLKCTTQMVTTSPQIPNPSPSFSDSAAQPVESSLAFPWTFPFGIDRRFHSDKSKLPESPRCLEQGTPGTSEVVVGRRLSDYLTCESSKTVSSPVAAEEEDVRVKVERLSDEEVQEASSQPVSASQSSLSDQQTVPGSEQVQEELLISPQSSSIGDRLRPTCTVHCCITCARLYLVKTFGFDKASMCMLCFSLV